MDALFTLDALGSRDSLLASRPGSPGVTLRSRYTSRSSSTRSPGWTGVAFWANSTRSPGFALRPCLSDRPYGPLSALRTD